MSEEFVDEHSFDSIDLDCSMFENEEQITEPEFPKEGIYHFVVQDVNPSNPKWPGTAFFKFEIIMGNVKGQESKIVYHTIWAPRADAKNPENAKKQYTKSILMIMLALGMRKPSEIPSNLRVNQDFWNSMEGKQFMGRVTHKVKTQTSESGNKFQMTNAVIANRHDMLPMFHKDITSVPFDAAAAEMGGYVKSGEDKAAEI